MHQALADFRIESDRVIFLKFADGRSCRVNPGDLGRFLHQDDVRRVRQALRLRRQFMRRILPPTALILLAAGIIGFGRYDIDQVSHGWLAPPPAAEQQTSKPVPASTVPLPAAQSTSPSSAPAATPAKNADNPTTSHSAPGRQLPAPAGQGLQSQTPKGANQTHANPASALTPVMVPVQGAVHRLSKLLP
jgi:hypothetical protein